MSLCHREVRIINIQPGFTAAYTFDLIPYYGMPRTVAIPFPYHTYYREFSALDTLYDLTACPVQIFILIVAFLDLIIIL